MHTIYVGTLFTGACSRTAAHIITFDVRCRLKNTSTIFIRNETSLWHTIRSTIDNDISWPDDIDLNRFRDRCVNDRAARHHHRPPFITVSQIEKERDIFHSQLFNLIYICSLDDSLGARRCSSDQFHTRLSRSDKEGSRPPETIPRESRSLSSAEFQRSRERCLGSMPWSTGIRSTAIGTTYEYHRPLRYSSRLLPSLLLRFHFVRWVSSWWKRIKPSRRSLERAESDIACLPSPRSSVENSRECGYTLLPRTHCYSFTELIIFPLKREAKWSSWACLKLN